MEKALVVNVIDLAQYVRPNSVVVSPIENGRLPQVLQNKSFFMLRNIVEYDPAFKQIIPYMCIIYNDLIFLTNRKSAQTETRLHNKYSIGVGGHINDSDVKSIDNIIHIGMLRELNEEVLIDENNISSIIPLYLLSDDTTEVGRVHLGIVYKVALKELNCCVREIDKMEGRWEKIENVRNYYDRMETRSQIILDNTLLDTLYEA
jgi:predicted NUDIX family phosphoesterase